MQGECDRVVTFRGRSPVCGHQNVRAWAAPGQAPGGAQPRRVAWWRWRA